MSCFPLNPGSAIMVAIVDYWYEGPSRFEPILTYTNLYELVRYELGAFERGAMNKNVIMIVGALIAIVGIGLWVQYTVVKQLQANSAANQDSYGTTAAPATQSSTGSSTTTTTTAPVAKKAVLTAPIHKKH